MADDEHIYQDVDQNVVGGAQLPPKAKRPTVIRAQPKLKDVAGII